MSRIGNPWPEPSEVARLEAQAAEVTKDIKALENIRADLWRQIRALEAAAKEEWIAAAPKVRGTTSSLSTATTYEGCLVRRTATQALVYWPHQDEVSRHHTTGRASLVGCPVGQDRGPRLDMSTLPFGATV